MVTIFADVEPGLSINKTVAEMVSKAETAVVPLINRVIGTTANGITRTINVAGESPLGNLIADIQRQKMAMDFGFMNAGGIRADIPAGKVSLGGIYGAVIWK